MKAKLVTAAVLLAIVLLFMLQNGAIVVVRLLFWQIQLPRFLLILVTLAIGIVVGWALRASYRTSKRS